MKKKTLLTVISVLLLATVAVLGTLAYLTDTDTNVNTFTVGQVDIKLDEAAVTPDGELILDENDAPVGRVQGNEYHLIPGKSYIKDPTVTVEQGSEESYIRMMVTFNKLAELDKIFAPDGADLTSIFGGYDAETWKYVGETRDETAGTITYEFRYKETVDGFAEESGIEAPAAVKLEPLFETFTFPGFINGAELATIREDFTITVEGHAIQAVGFEDDAATGETAEDAAWKAFDIQIEMDKQKASAGE